MTLQKSVINRRTSFLVGQNKFLKTISLHQYRQKHPILIASSVKSTFGLSRRRGLRDEPKNKELKQKRLRRLRKRQLKRVFMLPYYPLQRQCLSENVSKIHCLNCDWWPGMHFVVWPPRWGAAGHGMVFDLSVLNRANNFARVCPEQGI